MNDDRMTELEIESGMDVCELGVIVCVCLCLLAFVTLKLR